MDSLLDNKAVRKFVKNILLSQKRFDEAKELTDEHVQDCLYYLNIDNFKSWYISGDIDVEELEELIEFKLNLQGV